MDVGVIGGGAAGMFAAIFLARGGANVELFEKNEKLGKKLYITGKGRCNLTNDCDLEPLFANIVHGEKFLRSALHTLPPANTMSIFEELGVPLVSERGNRVFPASGKSSDVIRALTKELARLGVKTRLECAVRDVRAEGDKFVVQTLGDSRVFDRVIIATGGVSYPSTGSTGDGYDFGKRLGHSVVEPRPALAALITSQDVSSLEGISLKNVRLTAYCRGKEVAGEFGEALFTSKGISGPIALTISSYVARLDGITLSLDLKPALDMQTLDARLVREFSGRQNQDVKNVMRALLPERLNAYALKRAGVDMSKKANAVTKQERANIAAALKNMKFDVKAPAPFSEAIITSGGISLGELKPSGESKLVPGLYFAGEVMDVDALTGGFNLQIAWATAYLAAKTILKEANKG